VTDLVVVWPSGHLDGYIDCYFCLNVLFCCYGAMLSLTMLVTMQILTNALVYGHKNTAVLLI